METLEKLKILGAAAKYDVCAASGCGPGNNSRAAFTPPGSGVCHSFLPDGRCVSLFKVLQTNMCQKDCSYCPNRVQRDIPRTSFTPEELAGLFLEFHRRNYVEGLFLSSGICHSPSRTMEQMLKTIEILRLKYRYKGYIHLKILPGAKFEYIERAALLASRVSVNIEAPTAERLQKLSRLKNFEEEIIGRMKWVDRLNREGHLPAGQTTQFIVGAADETDAEILQTSTRLYTGVGLRRVYFSAFQPVPGTPLEMSAPAPVLREHRLYQSDFLMRQYGFSLEEICFNSEGNLSLDLDPKMNYAINNLHLFPMEINKASLRDLLRVPGIGPTSARRIIDARRSFHLNSLDELKNIGVVIKKASPFIQVNGRHRASYKFVQQLALWSDSVDHPAHSHPFFLS
ncbi:MAG: putative DNA modification/repair radical SAM protein [Eubacteriales bacterium]